MKHRFLLVEVRLYLPFSQSLKDKRQVKRSLVDSLRNLNLSVSETEEQELHQTLHLSMSYVALNESSARKMIEEIKGHIEKKLPGEAMITEFYEEIL